MNKSWPVLVSFPRDLTLSSLLGIPFIIPVVLMGRGMIQEHFNPFNTAWTQDLVACLPEINPENSHLFFPQDPGLGPDLNREVIKGRPYEITAFLNINEEGWEQRIGH